MRHAAITFGSGPGRGARRCPDGTRLDLAGRGSRAAALLARLEYVCGRTASGCRHRRRRRKPRARPGVGHDLVRRPDPGRRSRRHDPDAGRLRGHAAAARIDERRAWQRRRGRCCRRRGRRERRCGHVRAARPPRRSRLLRSGRLRRPARPFAGARPRARAGTARPPAAGRCNIARRRRGHARACQHCRRGIGRSRGSHRTPRGGSGGRAAGCAPDWRDTGGRCTYTRSGERGRDDRDAGGSETRLRRGPGGRSVEVCGLNRSARYARTGDAGRGGVEAGRPGHFGSAEASRRGLRSRRSSRLRRAESRCPKYSGPASAAACRNDRRRRRGSGASTGSRPHVLRRGCGDRRSCLPAPTGGRRSRSYHGRR